MLLKCFQKYRLKFNLTIILICLSSWAAPVLSDENTPQLIVRTVVNAELSQDSISKQGLRAIFKMRLKRWNDGTPIRVFVLEDRHDLHRNFCKQVLNIFPHQIRRIWNQAIYSGSGQAPTLLKSKQEMLDTIASTPGAIGYMNTDDLTEGIKLLNFTDE